MRPSLRLIQTPRLTLEPQLAAHADEMFRVLSDPAIYEHENEPPASIAWLRERFSRLESRTSSDGQEQWLNWVVRLPTSELIGYVQATILPAGDAMIAYVLSSAHWGKGLGTCAVTAMLAELKVRHGVHEVSAVLKRTNLRSHRLLDQLGFREASQQLQEQRRIESDELLMVHGSGPTV